MAPAALDEFGFPVGEGDMVFVTGGARGIVFECALGLAQKTGCQLFLTGRTPAIEGEPEWLHTEPDEIDQVIRQLEIGWVRGKKLGMREAKQHGRQVRSQWEIARNLRRLADAGIAGTYYTCDVSDSRSLSSALDAAKAIGAIRGIIHGAGVQKSLRLNDIDDAQLFATYDTKLVPLFTIFDKIEWRSLQFILGFGSVAGLFGNPGQTHYALANDAMTCMLRYATEAHPHVQAQTIQWTAWKGTGMVTAAQAKRFAEGGLVLLGIEEGVKKFLTTLSRGREHRELAVFNASSDLAAVRPIVSGFKRSRLVSAPNGVPTRRARFSLDRDAYLHQHLVAGNPVVPGTFIAEMMAEICGGGTRVLRNVTFRRPLWVRDEGFEIEFVDDDGRIAVLPLRRREMPKAALANLEFANCHVPSTEGDDAWPEDKTKLDGEIIDTLRDGVNGSTPEFYRILDQRFRQVLDTGAIFRGVTSMTEDGNSFYGLVRLTDEAMSAFEVAGGFRFNPVVADMAVQVAAAHGVLNRGVLAIPHSIERLYIGEASQDREAIVRCEPRQSAEDGAQLDVSIYALDGSLLLGFEGLTLKTLPSEV
jgi:NAD(P)-dependent dehydrogenase (short-subunit alcohol dehydrogenase family)